MNHFALHSTLDSCRLLHLFELLLLITFHQLAFLGL
jgi:hypothetical protein